MLPLLKYAEDNLEHSINEAIDYLANQFEITKENRNSLLP
ncbi:MAG: winged helix-turn-helix domain-containing protein, partial [Spirochaetes bacterium]|nr:winged helix-turn-helix domain-containing protein [Spirochaetota bacterium]